MQVLVKLTFLAERWVGIDYDDNGVSVAHLRLVLNRSHEQTPLFLGSSRMKLPVHVSQRVLPALGHQRTSSLGRALTATVPTVLVKQGGDVRGRNLAR